LTKIWAEAPLNPGGGGSYAIGGTGTNTHGFTGALGARQVITGITLFNTEYDVDRPWLEDIVNQPGIGAYEALNPLAWV
jgi:hypothetical protein